MQRIGKNFVIVESASALQGGNTIELYKLRNGAWVFGKDHNARAVQSVDEVVLFGERIQTAVGQWLERQAELAAQAAERAALGIPEEPAVAGPRADSTADKLARAIMSLSPEVQARMLGMIESVVLPQADSLIAGQEAEINPHAQFSPQVGQAAVRMPIPEGFPEGTSWANPNDPSAGLMVPTNKIDDKGLPIKEWKRTPEFDEFVNLKQDGGSLDTTKVVYEPSAEAKAAAEAAKTPGKRAQRSMGAKALSR